MAALDGRCDVDAAAERLPWPRSDTGSAAASFALDDGTWVHLIDMGAVVVEGHASIPEFVSRALSFASGRALESAAQTAWRIELGAVSDAAAADAARQVDGHRLVLQRAHPAWRRAAALVLAESAALCRHEAAATCLLADARAFAERLSGAARLPWSIRRAKRGIGALLRAQIESAGRGWEGAWPEDHGTDLAALREDLARSLRLPERRAALRGKLDVVDKTLAAVSALWHGRYSGALEWAIIALIAFEIVLSLLRHA